MHYLLGGYAISSAVTAAASPTGGFDVNQLLGLLGGGAGLAAGWKVVTLIIDKVVPSRSDKRSDVEASFSVLSETIKLLSAEKTQDSDSLARANERIEKLEASGASNYDIIAVLKAAKSDLESRIAEKDRHIAALTAKLGEYGARVTFEGDGTLRISTPVKATTGPISIP